MTAVPNLTKTEIRALFYLSSHHPRYVSQAELLDFLYGGIASKAAPRVIIRRIRQKLGEQAVERYEWPIGGYRAKASVAACSGQQCPKCARPMVSYADNESVCYSSECVGGLTRTEMAAGRAQNIGINGGRVWTAEETDFAVRHSADMTLEQIADHLGRSASGVRGQLSKMHVGKAYVLSAAGAVNRKRPGGA